MIEAGSKIGNYKVIRLLGEGGMGRVFEGIHEQIGRRAAIKVLHAQFAHNSEAYTRFLNEARAVNIVQHPGLVSVFEFGQTEDGSPYIVMEFLEGETLADRLATIGRMSMGALRIARQIASALMAAHAKHIVHRDLKPANVMLVPDPDMPGGERVKVVDFGIAKISAEHNDSGYKTRAGAILGTPTYMSPEQCRGAGEVTEKTDVYALGVMLYEMLVGRPPFVAEGGGEIMGMHLFQAPPPLHTLEPTLPLDLVDLVHTMLSKDPDARPSIIQVAQELDRIGGRLSGPMQAVSADVAAMAAEAKPPGPLTLPLELRRQQQVTSVSQATPSPPAGTAQPDAPSSVTPGLPALPGPPPAPPITPAHYTPVTVVPQYVAPGTYSPYITPAHYTPPYVTPAPYTSAPVTPAGLTLSEHASAPLSPGTTQILSSSSTPVAPRAPSEPPAPSAQTPVPPAPPAPHAPSANTPVTHAPSEPLTVRSPAEPTLAPAAEERAPPEALAAAEPNTATLAAANTAGHATPAETPPPGETPAGQTPERAGAAAVPAGAMAASESGPVKAGPHAPTIGVTSSPGEIPAPPSPTPPTVAAAVPAPPVAPSASPIGSSQAASPAAPATAAEKSPTLPPLSTAVVASAPRVPNPATAETEEKRALRIVLWGLAAAGVIMLTGLVIGLFLRWRAPQPAASASPDAAAVSPPSQNAVAEPLPLPQPAVTGSSPAQPDLGSREPDLAAPLPTPGGAPAVDAGTSDTDPRPKKKKPLQQRKKGLRNEEIEYLD